MENIPNWPVRSSEKKEGEPKFKVGDIVKLNDSVKKTVPDDFIGAKMKIEKISNGLVGATFPESPLRGLVWKPLKSFDLIHDGEEKERLLAEVAEEALREKRTEDSLADKEEEYSKERGLSQEYLAEAESLWNNQSFRDLVDKTFYEIGRMRGVWVETFDLELGDADSQRFDRDSIWEIVVNNKGKTFQEFIAALSADEMVREED